MIRYIASLVSAAGLALLSAMAEAAPAQLAMNDTEFDQILSQDIGDLVITSVSKHPEKLSDAAAAVYVITQEDLHRAGITSIPEALRMVPGMQVAEVASNRWAVSARGFNGPLANKLLVLIDGRTVYTPIFSGTYWDDQSTLIEDIDRIEVIRGPGASLWGANAVNGVINIITKHAADTQGNYASAAVGTQERFDGQVRHGGRLGNDAFYRVYAQYFDRDSTESPTGADNQDDWNRFRTGFRIDGKKGAQDDYMLQGGFYGGHQDAMTTFPVLTAPFTSTLVTEDTSYGGFALAKWDRHLSADSQTTLQMYADHYTRMERIATQHISTFDIDFQHALHPNDRNSLVWGAGYRLVYQDIGGTFFAFLNEETNDFNFFNAFVQDEYALVPNTLFLTLGAKLEHNEFTGFEFEPTARFTWKPVANQTVWGSISRAVRIPSIAENDINIIAGVLPGPTIIRAFGNPNLKAEELIAYELGYRFQPTPSLSLDTTVYLHDYDHLVTVESGQRPPFIGSGGNLIIPLDLGDLGQGKVYGWETAATWNVTRNWKLMGSYTLMKMDLSVDPASTSSLDAAEKLAPRHQLSARSYWTIRPDLQWDNMLYYVDSLGGPADSYLRWDTRLGWQVSPAVEIELIGRNLGQAAHAEFPANPQAVVERSALAQIRWSF